MIARLRLLIRQYGSYRFGRNVQHILQGSRIRSISHALTFSLLGKGIGFLVPLVIAADFGVSRASDSFFLAFAVTSILLPIWSQSVEQFAVPLFAEVESAIRVQQRMRWIRTRSALGAAVSAAIAGMALYTYLRLWSTADFRRSTMICYLLLVPEVVVSAWGAAYSAYVIARDEYRWPAGSIALRAVGVLLVLAITPARFGLASVAVGYSLGEFARMIALRWIALRKLHTEEGSSMIGSPVPSPGTLGRAAHQLSGMATMGVGALVERSFAATLGVGVVSRLEYATKLFYIPTVIFDRNLVSVFLSGWSRLVARREWAALVHDVRRVLYLVFLMTIVIAVFVVLAREPLTRLALVRGAFPASEVPAVAAVLGILMLALPFYATVMFASAAYVAIGENRLIFRVSVLKMCVWAAASLTLGRWFGLQGIAWAFVLAHAIQLVLLYLPLSSVVERHIAAFDVARASSATP